MAKKLSVWMIGGIIGIGAFAILGLAVWIMNMVTPGMGSQVWTFFGKIYLANDLSSPFFDVFTLITRWALIGILIGMIFDILKK